MVTPQQELSAPGQLLAAPSQSKPIQAVQSGAQEIIVHGEAAQGAQAAPYKQNQENQAKSSFPDFCFVFLLFMLYKFPVKRFGAIWNGVRRFERLGSVWNGLELPGADNSCWGVTTRRALRFQLAD